MAAGIWRAFLHDIHAKLNTLVANAYAGTRNQFFHFILRFAAERTANSLFSAVVLSRHIDATRRPSSKANGIFRQAPTLSVILSLIENLIDQAVIQRFLRGKEIVAFGVARDLLDWLARVFCQNAIQLFAGA